VIDRVENARRDRTGVCRADLRDKTEPGKGTGEDLNELTAAASVTASASWNPTAVCLKETVRADVE
jgi:hypothetical protein